MKKSILILLAFAAFAVNAQTLKTSKTSCTAPPAPTVSAVSVSYASNFNCPGDTNYNFTVSVLDKYSDLSPSNYSFKFTGITNPAGGCQVFTDGLGTYYGSTLFINFSKCSGCFEFDKPYTVMVQALCQSGYGTNWSPATSFILKKPAK